MNDAPHRGDPLAPVREQLARRDFVAAEATCRTVLASEPSNARALGLLAHVLNRSGRTEAAFGAAQEATRLAPGLAPAWLELAAAARASGRLDTANTALATLARMGHASPALHADHADVLAALGDRDGARAALEAALALDPRFAPAWLALAGLPDASQERLAILERANAAVPDHVPLLEALADTQRRALAPYADWIMTLRRLCALQPALAAPWLRLAAAYRHGDFYDAAHRARLEAFAREPAGLAVRWRHLQLPPDLVAADAASETAFLAQWHEGVAAFEALPALPPDEARACLVGATNVFLHYLYDEDTQPQRRYARVVRRFATSCRPDANVRRPVRARPRIGFVSAYFRGHTVGRLFADTIARMPAGRFERFAFHCDDPRDDTTARLASAVDGFETGERELESWAARLEDAALDAIVYADVGMHPGTLALAALRLAPVQVALWGHPVTTGLETIDAFVSSDLLEPADAQRHYTEPLHRLPGLGAWYDGPAAGAWTGADAGDGTIRCLVPASVYKLRPAFDTLLARVAAAVPALRFTLLPHARAHVCEDVARRLHGCFEQHGVDPARAEVRPTLPAAEFFALAARCDLALDTIGWSGGMTAIDLLGLGVPTIALEGATMRARQTAALLAHAGCPELVARDEDDYVAKAAALAQDRAARTAHAARLRESTQALYRDDRVVAGFATLLDALVRDRNPS